MVKRSPIYPLTIAVSCGLLSALPSPEVKPERKCRLKDCQRMTKHNGGYCCAKHHKLDKEKIKLFLKQPNN